MSLRTPNADAQVDNLDALVSVFSQPEADSGEDHSGTLPAVPTVLFDALTAVGALEGFRNRLHDLIDCVQLGSSSSDGGGHVKKCRRLIASIYLRVADDLVSNEATRLGSLSAPSMRNMLHSATFHRSMLVCSSLVVASTETAAAAAAAGGHSTGAGGAAVLTVDALTTALSVPAFEVCKVLNPFQKLIVPHLREMGSSVQLDVLHKLKESELLCQLHLALQSDSPLFAVPSSLSTGPAAAAAASADGAAADSASDNSAPPPFSQALSQPQQQQQQQDQQQVGSQATTGTADGGSPRAGAGTSSGGGGGGASSAGELAHRSRFLDALLILALDRTQVMCFELCRDLSESTVISMWKTVQYVVRDKLGLLRGRHLDQLLMCAVYAVCTLLLPSERISLSDIIARRDQLPLADRAAYRDVLIRPRSAAAASPAAGSAKSAGGAAATAAAAAGGGGGISKGSVVETSAQVMVTTVADKTGEDGKSDGSGEFEEEVRGDLKQFYEQVFVPQVGDFIMSLKTENVAQSMVQMFCGADGPMSPNGKQQLRIGNILLSPVVITPVPKLVDGVQEQMQQRQKAGSARMMHTCGISPGRSLVAINEHLENAERNARKRTTVGPGPGGSKTARLVGLSQYK